MSNPISDAVKRLRPGSGGPVETYSRTMLDEHDESLVRRGQLPPGLREDHFSQSRPIVMSSGTAPRAVAALADKDDPKQFKPYDPDDPRVLNKLFRLR